MPKKTQTLQAALAALDTYNRRSPANLSRCPDEVYDVIAAAKREVKVSAALLSALKQMTARYTELANSGDGESEAYESTRAAIATLFPQFKAQG